MSKRGYHVLISLCVVGMIVTLIFMLNKKDYESIDLAESKNRLQITMDDINLINDSVQQYAEDHDLDMSPLSEDTSNSDQKGQSSLLDPYKDQEGVTEFMLTSLIMGDVDMFIESFDIEVITKALFNVDKTDKTEVAHDYMNRITRNGLLVGFDYASVNGVLGTNASQSNVRLLYDDGMTIKIVLEYETIGNNHYKGDKVYIITTPLSDIITAIEKKAK